MRLGYSFPQPTVARLHNGKWAVVTGNGYDSTNKNNGKAALLIIDMETGKLTKSLEVTGAEGVANGLSTPKLADFNADGVADFAYAGDLQGNLWRFNLTPEDMAAPYTRQENETNTAEIGFKVSYSNKPIFKAVTGSGARQPITAAPSIIRHPRYTAIWSLSARANISKRATKTAPPRRKASMASGTLTRSTPKAVYSQPA